MRLMLAATLAFTLAAPLATLKFDAPPDWVSKAPSSSMRVAEWSLPKAAGDAEDATLTLYFFGASQGGNVQANLDRWIGQMAQPDGRAVKRRREDVVAHLARPESHARRRDRHLRRGSDVRARPSTSTSPAFASAPRVVETPGGPYFVKLAGPGRRSRSGSDSFKAFLKSLRYE